ncbi:hypothetical protein GGI12_003165, partial [Dipsacomyces acuminosporus]
HLGALKPMFTNTPARGNVRQNVYENARARILEHTELQDKQELAQCISAFSRERAAQAQDPSDSACTLLFGDLWTGSVFFNESTRAVSLLDLEFADVGHVYLDIAHFATYLLATHFLCSRDYDPNADPHPPSVREFLLAYKRTLLAECPEVYTAVADSAVRHSTLHMGAVLARDVLMGYHCRCGNGSSESNAPLACKCGDTLLRFARSCIKGTTSTLFCLLNVQSKEDAAN